MKNFDDYKIDRYQNLKSIQYLQIFNSQKILIENYLIN
jgi:hypothetical protein